MSCSVEFIPPLTGVLFTGNGLDSPPERARIPNLVSFTTYCNTQGPFILGTGRQDRRRQKPRGGKQLFRDETESPTIVQG